MPVKRLSKGEGLVESLVSKIPKKCSFFYGKIFAKNSLRLRRVRSGY